MKLSSLTIIWLGIVIAICALSWGYFWFYQPNMAEAKMWQDRLEAQKGEIAKRPALIKNEKKAEDEEAQLKTEWNDIISRKTPNSPNLDMNQWQLTVETRKFRDQVQADINAMMRKGNVKIVGSGPFIPLTDDAPASVLTDFYNFQGLPFPVLIFDLGTVRIQGTWNQIMAHIHAWKSMPNYMAVVHGLDVQGTSPLLTATYQLTIIGYIKADKVHPTAPDASAATGTGAGGGGGGGLGGPQGGLPPSAGPGRANGGRTKPGLTSGGL